MKAERGSVLGYVLVLLMILMIISASMARMLLLRGSSTQRLQDDIYRTKDAGASTNALVSAWTQDGQKKVCDPTTASNLGFTCASNGAGSGFCTNNIALNLCTCTANNAQNCPTLKVLDGPAAGECAFQAISCQ